MATGNPVGLCWSWGDRQKDSARGVSSGDPGKSVQQWAPSLPPLPPVSSGVSSAGHLEGIPSVAATLSQGLI